MGGKVVKVVEVVEVERSEIPIAKRIGMVDVLSQRPSSTLR